MTDQMNRADQTGSPTSDRSRTFRAALVSTATLGPYRRRRPPFRLVIGAIAAFAVAGALTGAAVATTTAAPDRAITRDLADAQAAGTVFAHSLGAKLVGTPFSVAGRGSQKIDLGARPTGATAIVDDFQCLDTGTFTRSLDGRKYAEDLACAGRSGGGDVVPVTGSGSHTLSVSTRGSARFVIWASWVSVTPLARSAAQESDLADGVVTRDEDVAAFARFEGCMDALGHGIDYPVTKVVPFYSTGGREISDGTANRCYVTEYAGVDERWQLQLRQTSTGEKSIDACLRAKGVDPSASPAARSEQLFTLGLNAGDCTWIS
jgi:hypothetical protein